MGFFSMCLLGYKIIAFIALGVIVIGSVVIPLWLTCEDDTPAWLLLYILSVPILCGCIKLMQLF